jgi:hypothetical protein
MQHDEERQALAARGTGRQIQPIRESTPRIMTKKLRGMRTLESRRKKSTATLHEYPRGTEDSTDAAADCVRFNRGLLQISGRHLTSCVTSRVVLRISHYGTQPLQGGT